MPKKSFNILDTLPEHRAERCQILLSNLKNEDLVHIADQKIPAFLRIDRDVQARQQQLLDFFSQYMEFNIDELDYEMKEKLAKKIAEVSFDYNNHNKQVAQMLLHGAETNNNTQAIQDKII